ncbi:MAG TPA: type II toxin-antitoxin system death-on-curing family toxin [Terriglobia bacterium]
MARRSSEPRWLSRVVVDAIHGDQIREHGGLPGIRDENALESALARPRHKWLFDNERDLAVLAAGYGFALVRNHPYRDGYKRIGFLAMATFLGINGRELKTTDAAVVTQMFALAAGDVSEERLAAWVRERMTTRK